jgi:hypothetical protein
LPSFVARAFCADSGRVFMESGMLPEQFDIRLILDGKVAGSWIGKTATGSDTLLGAQLKVQIRSVTITVKIGSA